MLIRMNMPIFASAVALALALSGCGGGGSSTNVAAPSIPVSPVNKPATIEDSLASATNGLQARSFTLERTWSVMGNSAALSDVSRVNSIRTDETGALVVSYVLEGATNEVAFSMADCLAADDCAVEKDGVEHYLWSQTSDLPFERSVYRFMDILNYYWTLDDAETQTYQELHMRFVFGTRTEALPMTGSAIYRGNFSAKNYNVTVPGSSARFDLRGVVRLFANFDMSELQGRISAIRSGPTSSSLESRPTSSFEITDAQMQNGQFTATLTGVESDPTVPFDESVRGFMGSILGDFYGPNAEEVGGVLTAERDEDGDSNMDRLLVGSFGATSVDSGSGNSDAIIVGVDFDQVAKTAKEMDDTQNVRFETMTNGVVRLTYMENGSPVSIEWGDDDLRYYGGYGKMVGSDSYWLTSETGGISGSSAGTNGLNYFDVYFWEVWNHVPGTDLQTANYDADDSPTYSVRAFVDGSQTPGGVMPTYGNATYRGVFGAFEIATDNPIYPFEEGGLYYEGDATLAADFGTGSISGTLDSNRRYYTNPGAVSGAMTFTATVNGNTLSASDLTGSGEFAGYENGSVHGAFYGPAAEEIGGVFDAANSTNTNLLTGYFGGSRRE